MPLENSTYVDGLDSSWPLGGDPTNRGDDHLRLLKSVLKSTFPGAGGQGFAEPITATEAELNFSSGVTSNLQTQINGLLGSIREALYPIGSIYTNAVNATNPGILLGFGTWVAFGTGRVMVGVNGADPIFSTPEKTGGTKDSIVTAHTHTLSGTATSAGAHTHGFGGGRTVELNNSVGPVANAAGGFKGGQNIITISATDSAGTHSHALSGTALSTGESGVDKNVQPFITVYMWKRTS